MKTKKIWATLAVSDLERTTTIYTQLGFKTNNSNGSYAQELTSFSFGENDSIVNFFLKDGLQKKGQSELIDLKNGNEIILRLSA